ncbi:COG4315 family predicted lipoprotein [Lentzea sp. CA-135723]|uniref:COG4315 family predicted lipoprotein n=1 Tax=Lentzea sp. CA-135723 TaxID=3239950 RepID=UPI003D8D0DD0
MSRFAVLVLLVCLGACSAPPEEETASPAEPEAAAGPVVGPTKVLPGDIAKLQVEESPAVGAVVADRERYTLYFTVQDGPSKPTCLEPDCTLVWPPLLAAGGRIEAPGVDQALLGTTKRPDGLEQVTIAGKPVYRYVDDEQAGDTTGHGVDDKWFAISPSGTKATK